ncbi:MAG: hypothetical protein D5R99_00140 [Methanocalculus sp. MSAO_Arc1]|nr:MAG: hypothetical protein D5R99_00140 [Methanocalculus sp. MSAO_Arc1]
MRIMARKSNTKKHEVMSKPTFVFCFMEHNSKEKNSFYGQHHIACFVFFTRLLKPQEANAEIMGVPLSHSGSRYCMIDWNV